mgnify:CR=1 FL=1
MTEIIAEIGSVHDGSFGNACKLIKMCSRLGVSTVKFQMHLAEYETTQDAPSPKYFNSEDRYSYFQRTCFSKHQWSELISLANKLDISFCCSPFSIEALELLIELGVDNIKIASGEITNLPLIEKAAQSAKKLIISSGMSSWVELDSAMRLACGKCKQVTLLQCTSEYPCPPEHVGLNVMQEMRDRYGVKVGISDHTLSIAAPIAAVALGATVVEKHLTFSRSMYGSDAKNSLEPNEFQEMVRLIREVDTMLSSPIDKSDLSSFENMKNTFEKSLVAKSNIEAGSILTQDNIAFKKPGTGLSPSKMDEIVGKKLIAKVSKDYQFKLEDFE